MQKAISLIEVLISIILITVVIVSILQMKNNNLFFLDKFKTSSQNNSYIGLAVQDNTDDTKKNENIYLDKMVDFGDDDISIELKKYKITRKTKQLKDIEIPKNDYIKIVSVVETEYILIQEAHNIKQNFYTFKLE